MIRAGIFLGSLLMAMGYADAAQFAFEYAQHAGYGETPVRITIEGLRATLIRQESLGKDRPLGVFHATISTAAQKGLDAAVPDTLASNVEPSRDSGFFTIRLRTVKRNVELRIAQHPDAMSSAEALMQELNHLETGLPWKPERALEIELIPGASNELLVRLHNPGARPVHVDFKGLALAVESLPAARPPETPGVSPPPRVWRMASVPETLPPGVDLAAGSSTEIPIAVTAPSADMLYRARFYVRGSIDPDKPNIYGLAYSNPIPGPGAR